MKRIIYLALLYLVTAHEDDLSHVSTRGLAKKGKLCSKLGGELMTVKDKSVIVDGDWNYWKDISGFQSPYRTGKKKVDDTPIKFCGEIDGMVHELTAPKFLTRKIVKKTAFTKGGCDGNVQHTVEMTLDQDVDEDDCYCKKNNGCYCECACTDKGAGIIDFSLVKDKKKKGQQDEDDDTTKQEKRQQKKEEREKRREENKNMTDDEKKALRKKRREENN